MRLHYYTSAEHAIDDIENERIKISVLDAVNDPNEWVPNIELTHLPIESIREMIMQSYNIEWGFISFSKSWNIAPMWGMYADKFKGAVLEFEIDDALVREVEYTATRVSCKMNIAKDFDAEDFEKVIRRKSLDWSYEQEVRYIIQLFPRNCELVNDNYFAKIGIGKENNKEMRLTSVRCGPLMSQQNYRRLKYQQRTREKDIAVIRTRFGQTRFDLDEVTL